jgi:hypothetical protein
MAGIPPVQPRNVFSPPEEVQRGERATETLARPFVEKLTARDPLTPELKSVGGELVRYGFGAGCGGLFGLARESF